MLLPQAITPVLKSAPKRANKFRKEVKRCSDHVLGCYCNAATGLMPHYAAPRPGLTYAMPYENHAPNPHERRLQLPPQQHFPQQQQQQQQLHALMPPHMGLAYPAMLVRTDFELAPSHQQNQYHQRPQPHFRQQQQPVHEVSASYYHHQQQLMRDAPVSFVALQSQPRCLESLPSLQQHIAAMPFTTNVAPLMSAYGAAAQPAAAPPAASPAKGKRKLDVILPSGAAASAQQQQPRAQSAAAAAACDGKLLERASKAAAQQRKKLHPPPSEAYLLDRRRLRKSCNSCVRAKRRCDGNWPCSRCASGNKECQYR
jgi:Fungal Zn(2)-Cys(6) binuclear cluster domain